MHVFACMCVHACVYTVRVCMCVDVRTCMCASVCASVCTRASFACIMACVLHMYMEGVCGSNKCLSSERKWFILPTITAWMTDTHPPNMYSHHFDDRTTARDSHKHFAHTPLHTHTLYTHNTHAPLHTQHTRTITHTTHMHHYTHTQTHTTIYTPWFV